MFAFDFMQTIYLIRVKAQLKKDGSIQIIRWAKTWGQEMFQSLSLWGVVPCKLVQVYGRFRGSCCLIVRVGGWSLMEAESSSCTAIHLFYTSHKTALFIASAVRMSVSFLTEEKRHRILKSCFHSHNTCALLHCDVVLSTTFRTDLVFQFTGQTNLRFSETLVVTVS
jgi:hypothetical protein